MTIWQQYQEIAHIFTGWGHEKAEAVTNKVLGFSRSGIGLIEQKCPPGATTLISPSQDAQHLLRATGLSNHTALSMLLEGYLRLPAERKTELLARKMPGTPKRTGWR